MKRIVVTGATSMLGIGLIRYCIEHGIEVLAICRENSPREAAISRSELLRVCYADLDELDQVQEPGTYECFYHFGWASTDKEGRRDTEKQLHNAMYTLKAIRLAYRLGCRKFIGAGSQAEYGTHWEKTTSPESPADPQLPYGIAKFAAGRLGSILAEQLGMDFFWVRIFSVYGPNDQNTTMIQSTIALLRAGQSAAFTPATHTWDYLYVEDAAEAFAAIGQYAQGNKVYCLGSGQGYALKEYILELAQQVDPQAKLEFGQISYNDGVPPGMCADISSLTRDTGWQPRISFREGVRRLLENMDAE